MKRTLIALLVLAAIAAFAQTYQSGSDAEPIINPLRSNYIPSGAGDRMIVTDDVSGPYVLETSVSGTTLTIRQQNTQDVVETVTFHSGGGGTGLDLATVLGAIMPGSQIAIDRSTTGQITINYDPAPVSDHNRYAVWTTTSTTPTPAQFTAADSSMSSTITVRATPGGVSSYLHFADIDATLSDIRESGSAFNSRSLFADTPVQIVIGGTTHYVYSTRFAVHAYLTAQAWVLTP